MNRPAILLSALILSVIPFEYCQNQTIQLAFVANYNGQNCLLDSVFISNISKNVDTTLYAPNNILIMDITTGMNKNNSNGNNGFLLGQNYPNPFSNLTIFSIYLPEEGLLKININNLLGSMVANYSGIYKMGYHTFTFIPGNDIIYIVEATFKSEIRAIKMLNLINSNHQCELIYSGGKNYSAGFKAKPTDENFAYSIGDYLRFTGYSTAPIEILASDIIEDSPEESQIYTFNIIEGMRCPTISKVSYGDHIYNTVQIGNQCWFRENLNEGNMINGSIDQSDNNLVEKYCYMNDAANCIVYGGLYQWDEMMQYVTTENTQGICPPGWQIPDHADCLDLVNYLPYPAGGMLKEIGTTHWAPPNAGATDAYGFTALPGGFRDYYGYFGYLYRYAYFWTSSEYGGYNAYMIHLSDSSELTYIGPSLKVDGFSVRCFNSTNPAPAQVPFITTFPVINITMTSAVGCSNVTFPGSSSVTKRGVCWSTIPDPDITDPHTEDGFGCGVFQSQISELNPNTDYYLRSYAINSYGTGYGEQFEFTTTGANQAPVVTTTEISNIGQTTATGGGNVLSQGSSTITNRGVCWDTELLPDLNDPHSDDGVGSGIFNSQLTGLNPNTTYYVRAFAINSSDTSFGEQVYFITLGGPCLLTPEVIYGGQVYITAQLGSQCWLGENLNIGTMIMGGNYQTNNQIIEKYCYNDNPANCEIYGGLYQWNEMMDYTTLSGTQGICPPGWYIPNKDDWTTLANFLGGENEAGGKLKEEGTSHWMPPNTGATNASFFTGLPGGYKDAGYYAFINFQGYFWSSYLGGTYNDPWKFKLSYNTSSIGTGYTIDDYGFSVRCLQGELAQPPIVVTSEIINITDTSAVGGGNVISQGTSTVIARGVCWSLSQNPTINDFATNDGGGLGTFVSQITGLLPGTIYYCRAYATNSDSTAYGDELYFETTGFIGPGIPCPEIPTVTYEGKTYNTVLIGDQCWLKENLDIGIMLTSQWPTNNGIIEKWCYSNQAGNCAIYGGLYPWDELMQYSTIQGAQGICPEGWHVPTFNDFEEMKSFLGGSTVAGGKMKEQGTEHWSPPNTGATNESGFTGLPGGYRSYGMHYLISDLAYFWSSSIYPVLGTPYFYKLYYNNTNFSWDGTGFETHGLSVRCIKD